jgi:hypothetical protein
LADEHNSARVRSSIVDPRHEVWGFIGMPVVRWIVVGLISVGLLIALTACQPTPTKGTASDSGSRVQSNTTSSATDSSAGNVVWGRVPYCNCFNDSATTNVANALKAADLTVSLKELSPRDGWLYFVVTFDPDSATQDQIGAAMDTGGAEVLAGPP